MGNIVTLPLIGYAPDLDPAQPGVFSYCQGVESTTRGWRIIRASTSQFATDAGSPLAAGSYALDGYISNVTDGTEVQHASVYDSGATKYKLFANISGTLTDKSRAGSYTASGTETFSFCQYGNYTLATNLVDALQIRDSSGSGAFADSAATNIPKAKLCVTWGPPTAPMVMLLHYNPGAVVPDGWWNSSTGGPTASWGPDSTAGSANGRLLGAGPLRCGIAYRDDIVVFGDRQMWIGRFVGAPEVMEWTRVTDEIGCVGQWAAKVINGTLYFIGDQGLFTYDGTFPRKAQFPIQQEIIVTLATLGTSKRLVQVVADGSGQRLQIALRTNAYGTTAAISKWYLINLLNGRVSLRGTTTLAYKLVLDRKYQVLSLPTAGASGNIEFWQEQATVLTTTLANSRGFGLNYIGSDYEYTKIQSVMPRFTVAPSSTLGSYSVTNYYGPSMSEALGSSLSPTVVSASPWKANYLWSSNWHAPRLLFSTGLDMEVIDVSVEVVKTGTR